MIVFGMENSVHSFKTVWVTLGMAGEKLDRVAESQAKTIYFLTVLLIIICQFLLFSCQYRNPNLSETQLLALLNDTSKIIAETPDVFLPDTNYIPSVGAKFTEIRTVAPASPPVTLKIRILEDAKQTLKLSMFGSSIEYVTLKLPEQYGYFASSVDLKRTNFSFKTADFGEAIIKYYSSNTNAIKIGNHFITYDMIGIRLFDINGVFVKNILLSEFEGERDSLNVEIKFENYKQAVLRDIIGNKCFLAMFDHNLQKIYLGEYQIGKSPDPEIVMTFINNFPWGTTIDNNTLFKLNINNIFAYVNSNHIAVSLSFRSDTLCKFNNYIIPDKNIIEKLRNYAHSDNSFSYRFNDELFFRQAYNDTVFRVKSANRIIPAYLFDFGSQKVTIEEGLSAKTEGKLLLWWFVELKNSIILIFTEGRDCPNCREKGEVKFHCLVYDKQTKRYSPIDMNSTFPESAMIENDLDGGLPLLLTKINLQKDGIVATFTKKQIENILNNKNIKIPSETVSKFQNQANVLKQNEMLLMIIR